MQQKSYVEIQTESLVDNHTTNFDIYTLMESQPNSSLASDYLLYAKAPYKWTLRELTDLTRVGIHKLFIAEEEHAGYLRYVRSQQEMPKIDQNLAPKFRIQQIQDIGQHLVECCFISEISPQLIGKLEYIAQNVVQCLQEDPDCVLHIQSLAEYDLYTYVHSVGVGTLSAAIAMKLGVTNPEELTEYALGGVLHDVGKKFVPLRVLNKPGPLLPDEWQLMKSHPNRGAEALKEQKLSGLVMDMVAMHHEKLDGSGYPNGILGPNLPTHVQLATVADIFNALTTSRSYHRKRSRFEGLMFMKHHLKGKISVESFKGLVACLMPGTNIS